VFIFLVAMLAFIPNSKDTADNTQILHLPSVQIYSNLERNWTTNIILINYDPQLINETALFETLPLKREYHTTIAPVTYNIDYELYQANDSYTDSLRQVILEHSIIGSDIGTELNETALAMQRESPNTPLRIFNERAGRTIDGYAVEDWLIQNPFVPAPELGYNFYLLNLSEFDTLDHSMEHWFDYHPMDSDTGMTQSWFRLEFDNSKNPPIVMQYAGIGGRGNVYALDPSANQWYMRWARLWWHDYIHTEYDHWTKDLEDISRELNFATIEGVRLLNEYLRNYVYDIVAYLLFPYQHNPVKPVASGELKIEVICINEDERSSADNLDWITDAKRLSTQLEELCPFIDWEVNVSFINSKSDVFWNNIFWTYTTVNAEGVTEVDGSSLFDYIFENVRPYRIATDPENVNIYGVVFIKKNMHMFAGDGTYTGLGMNGPNGGQTLVCKSLERYFCFDSITPREGVSGIQLHESMHALGFAHTWQDEHYASDFSYGPMGYFAMHNGTSSFDKNWAQGIYLDQMELELWNDFVWKQGYLSPENPEKTYIAESKALEAFTRARDYYNRMNWMDAYKELCVARDWTKRMIYSRFDDTPPLIDTWGTNPSSIDSNAFTYWVHVTDRSGLENVSLQILADGNATYLLKCFYDNPYWIVFVPDLPYQNNLTLLVVAWDWGMNKVEGGFMIITEYLGLSPSEFLLLFIVLLSATGIVIVIILGAILKKEFWLGKKISTRGIFSTMSRTVY
jgi:hypothetical protein